MKQPWRVAILSPQEVVATGLRSMIEQYPERLEVVEISSGFGDVDPDVVLYDVLALHETDSGELEHLVKQTSSAVLAVDRDLRPDLGARALALGADGFLSIGTESGDLVDMICSAADPTPGDGLPEHDATNFEEREHRLGHDVGLTPREVQILEQITRGLSNQEIAEQSYLSINSVKTYIRSAYRRMGVTSRSQAVAWCIQHGFSTQTEG